MVEPTSIVLGIGLDKDDTSLEEESDESTTISSSSEESDDSSSGDDDSLTSLRSSTTTSLDYANGLNMTLAMVQQLRRSTSSGNLMGDDTTKTKRRNSTSSDGYLNPKKDISKILAVVQTRSSKELPLHQRLAERNVPSPKVTFEATMKERDLEVKYISSEFLRQNGYFVEGTEVGYSLDLVNAVGKHDMRYLRKHQRLGGNLQCRNRFGESLVHAVVRKGTAEMLEFLIAVGEVSIQVCCDGGRTPLHDACWAATPDFEIVRCLLVECPDLLLVTDKRGFSPLNYIPRDSYRAWNEFLQTNDDIIAPKGVFHQGSPLPSKSLKHNSSFHSQGLYFL